MRFLAFEAKRQTYERKTFFEFELGRDQLLVKTRHVNGISDALAQPEIVNGDLRD